MQQQQGTPVRKNVIQVSLKRNAPFFMYLTKLFLRDFPTVELHALGEAISISVRVAEQLARLRYINIKKIETLTFASEHTDRDGKTYQRNKVKMIVIVERGQEFEKLMANFKPPQKK